MEVFNYETDEKTNCGDPGACDGYDRLDNAEAIRPIAGKE